MKKYRINDVDLINKVLTVMILIFAFLPDNKSYNWLIYGLLMILWIITAYFNNHKVFKEIITSKLFIVMELWPLFNIICSVFGYARLINSIYLLLWPILFMIGIYNVKCKNNNFIYKLLLVFIILIFIINIYTVYMLQTDILIARNMSAGTKVHEDIYYIFLGNYQYLFAISIISVLLIGVLKANYIGKKKFFSNKMVLLIVVLIISNGIVLVKSNFLFSLLFFIFFSILVLIFPKKIKIKHVILTFALIAILVVFGGRFLIYFSTFIKNPIFSERILEVGKLFTFFSVSPGSDVDLRITVYMRSIETFINNPLLGVGKITYSSGGLVGCHSEILDNFAYFGIIGGGIYLLSTIYSFILIAKKLIDFKYLFVICSSMLIFMGIVDSTNFEQFGMAIYIFIPLVIYIIKVNKDNCTII